LPYVDGLIDYLHAILCVVVLPSIINLPYTDDLANNPPTVLHAWFSSPSISCGSERKTRTIKKVKEKMKHDM
jgi:hypothetical protein